MMVSSRFHAIVTSMPGLVASGGVTMDERIRNLMNDRGHPDLFLEVDEDDLGDKMLAMLRRLYDEGDKIAEDIAKPIIELAVDQRGDSLSFLVCHGLKHPGWFRPITCGPRTGACVIGHATPNHSHLRQTKGNRCCTQGSSSGRSRLSMASRALKMRDLTVPIGQSIALAISS
jgi:hypothetical protein